MLVRNKWNGHDYKIIEDKGKEITLQREDGTQFTIAKSEFYFSYSVKK